MASFVLRPKKLSSITFDLAGSNPGGNYVVAPASINMNEKERIKVVYSSLDMGGLAIKSTSGLVESSFIAVIFGANQAAAMANFRTLCAALRQEGTLEYVPVGLSGVMSTYYHYLPSAPPEIIPGSLDESVMGSYGRSGGNGEYAVVCRVTLTNKAIATSDVTAPVTIVSQTTLDGFDDSGDTNYVVAQSSSIKGDFLFPIIEIATDGSASIETEAIVHIRPMIVGSNTNYDYTEAEDEILTYFAPQVDASSSGGYYATSTTASGASILVNSNFASFDSTYLGFVVPMFYVYVPSGTTWTIIPQLREFDSEGIGPGSVIKTLDTKTIVGSSSWELVYDLNSIMVPPSKITDLYTDSTTPSIGSFSMRRLCFTFGFTRTVGSGEIRVDFFIAARSDFFLSLFSGAVGSATAQDLVIDSYNTIAYKQDRSVTAFFLPWANQGTSYSNMILHRGFDYRIRILKPDGLASAAIPTTVKGIHGTIYPFEVS